MYQKAAVALCVKAPASHADCSQLFRWNNQLITIVTLITLKHLLWCKHSIKWFQVMYRPALYLINVRLSGEKKWDIKIARHLKSWRLQSTHQPILRDCDRVLRAHTDVYYRLWNTCQLLWSLYKNLRLVAQAVVSPVSPRVDGAVQGEPHTAQQIQ